VFVFDGGAPALKRQTILGRMKRREGRRDDAVRTAGKLLAVQMQRRLEEGKEKKKREKEVRGREVTPEDEEQIPEPDQLIYVEELGMSKQERQQTRKFHKTDAYHLPDLHNGIENMGQPNDPRIMTAEELEEYARQFDNGEDVNLYDFSKIDFDGEFFRSLPAVDRYNILNAARLRSRLRMGLSKEQLEDMFPDRMAFSRFQIERVRERNGLTQRLMNLNGMNDKNAMLGISGRVVGESGREYILVKNDGVEGGWALGVVSADRAFGERNKPIDVDNMSRKQYEDEDGDEDDEDFEDIPIEGLNRMPKIRDHPPNTGWDDSQVEEIAQRRRRLYLSRQNALEESDSMFVSEEYPRSGALLQSKTVSDNLEELVYDEESELNRAIAMSLQSQHDQAQSSDAEVLDFEDVPMPRYEQRIAEEPKSITASGRRIVVHEVNNRSNTAVRNKRAASVDSDDDLDLQTALALSRQQNNTSNSPPSGAPRNIMNQFDGPLPFPRLNFESSLFGGPKGGLSSNLESKDRDTESQLEGGFEHGTDKESPKPLPPWLESVRDIRFDIQQQIEKDIKLNDKDREMAVEEEKLLRNYHGVIEVESSDDESDVEIIDVRQLGQKIGTTTDDISLSQSAPQGEGVGTQAIDSVYEGDATDKSNQQLNIDSQKGSSYRPHMSEESSSERLTRQDERKDFQTTLADRRTPCQLATENSNSKPSRNPLTYFPVDTEYSDQTINTKSTLVDDASTQSQSPSPPTGNIEIPVTRDKAVPETRHPYTDSDEFDRQEADTVSDIDFDETIESDDEELLAQLAMEAEEHVRFLSTLNNRSERHNQEAYELELRNLRNQQKKDRRDADEVSQTMIVECQALLRLFGIPYITAPMEAEAQCAELVRLGLVDGIITDDSDIFLFGGNRVYKNMFTSNKDVECYLSSHIEKELSLSRHQLISIAHLLGSDYTEGLPGIGPVTAVEIISEFSSSNGLEEFKAWWEETQSRPKDADISTPFRKKFRRTQATKLFLPSGFPSPAVTEAYIKPQVDNSPEPFQWGAPDLDNLRSFLMSTVGWSQERTDEVLVPVIRDMNRREIEGTQSNITRYFEGGVGAGAVGPGQSVNDAFAPQARESGSKRMREAVKKLKAKKMPLNGTFADEAAQWAAKEAKRLAREKQTTKGKGKGRARRKKRDRQDSENEDDEIEDRNGGDTGSAEAGVHDASAFDNTENEEHSEKGDGGEGAQNNTKANKGKGRKKRKKISN
jgi:DNA excision repair protein ERCC-5